jgi:hypothetical protein
MPELFTGHPTYDPYRPLELRDPYLFGEDVFALQTALSELVGEIGTDGWYGEQTDHALDQFQERAGIWVPKPISGPATQNAIVRTFISRITSVRWRRRQMLGQIEKESSKLLGNYSAQRENGSYDAGVTQRNTQFTPARQGFNVPLSMQALFEVVGQFYALYEDTSKFRPWSGDYGKERRRRLLAIGAWNGWAYTNYLAGVRPWAVPGPSAAAAIEAYMLDAGVYL